MVIMRILTDLFNRVKGGGDSEMMSYSYELVHLMANVDNERTLVIHFTETI